MKTLKLIAGIVLIGAISLLMSCTKEEGTGGKAHIHGKVVLEANGARVLNAPVYIWYGATSEDGVADASTMTNRAGLFRFTDLQKGAYYLSCSSTASNGRHTTGGAWVTVTKKKDEVDVLIHLE